MTPPGFDRPSLERLFVPLETASTILIAVSGGPDSIALMHLLARWNDGPSPKNLIVATVDHGLRAESAEEARWVGSEAASLGLPHHVLPWTGAKPATGLQEQARAARYGLLIALAKEAGSSHLVTAHTRDDQAETILMRIARGSGPTGLRGMEAERDRDGIRHLRPLLSIPKADLLELCARERWRFVTDPSNADERFARARWRRLLPDLAAEGLTADRLSELARRVGRIEEALGAKTEEAYKRAILSDPTGGVVLDASVLASEPTEIALRMLQRGLSEAGLPEDRRRLQRIETCVDRLVEAVRGKRPARMNIAGALLDLEVSGRLGITPEKPRKRGR